MKQTKMEEEAAAEEKERKGRGGGSKKRRRVTKELNSFPARGDVKPRAQLQESRNGTDRQ